MSNSRYLIATDLDNTILSKYYSLSADSVQALIDAQEAGHLVMIATARPESMSLPYHRTMGLRGPLSMLNGARMEHPDDPNFPAVNHLIPRDVIAEMAKMMTPQECDRFWLVDGNHVYAHGEVAANQAYMRELFRQGKVDWFDDLPIYACNRVYAYVRSEETGRAIYEHMQQFKDEIDVTMTVESGGICRFHCISPKSDKWYTVKRAAEIYDIPVENIVTFGDEENDRKMLLNAGHGFVMCNGNAKLREDVLAAGQHVTELPCAEGGVGHEVRKLLSL